MRGVARLFAIIVAGAATAASGATSQPARSLAFSSNRAPNLGQYQLYRVGLNGRRSTLAGGLPIGEFRLGRAGRLTFVTVDEQRAYRVESVRLDGSGREVLAVEAMQIREFAPSPDGRFLALAMLSTRPCGSGSCQDVQLWVVTLASGKQRKVADRAGSVSWSPDSRRLAYADVGTRIQKKRFYVVDRGGGPRRVLGRGTYPSWSPDGRHIAYVNGDGVWVVEPDGSHRHRIAKGYLFDWSPDGRSLVVTTDSLSVVGLDGMETRLASPKGSIVHPVFSPDGRRVAYLVSAPDGSSRLFVVGAGGGAPRQLTSDRPPTYYGTFAWMLDGRAIAYATTRYENDSEIYVADADGRSAVAVTRNDVDDLDPSWSPDGRRLLFSRVVGLAAGQAAELWAADARGGRERRILSAPARAGVVDLDPAWSPDGRTVAFTRGRLTDEGELQGGLVSAAIAMVRPDGAGFHFLTSPPGLATAPAWSPDGTRIAFTYAGGPYEHPVVDVVAATGGMPRPLIDLSDAALPSWSPDGGHVAFVHYHDATNDLEVAEADGSAPAVVVSGSVAFVRPAWSPDGRELLYVRDDRLGVQIHRVRLDGSDDVPVTTPPGISTSPDWLRASR